MMRSTLRILGWIAVAVLAAWYLYFQGYVAFRAKHSNDFKHMYLGAVFLRVGQSPYEARTFIEWSVRYGFETINPYVYPPTAGILMRPLTWISPRRAAEVWFVLNHLMLLASLAILIHCFLGWRNPWPIALLLLAVAHSIPVFRTFTAGQLNYVLLLLFCVAWWAFQGRRDWLAGLAVGLGALIKLLPGIFGLYFLVKRQWRAFGWTVAWSVAILLLSIAAAGWRVHADFIPVMRDMGYGKSVWEEILIAGGAEPFYRDPYNQSLNSLFHHILAADPVDPSWRPWFALGAIAARRAANVLTILSTLALVAVAFLAIFRLRPRSPETISGHTPPREAVEFSLMILLSLLVPSILWDHYLTMLLFPQAVLLGILAHRGQWLSPRMLLLIVASAIMAWPIAFGMLAKEGIELLLISAKLLGVLILYGLTIDALRLTKAS